MQDDGTALRIFISYRRADSAHQTERLVTSLREHLPDVEVFRDIDDIKLGQDFIEEVERAIKECHVCLVMMGAQWTGQREDDESSRLLEEADPVRLEVGLALERDIYVIPVLLEGAGMPSRSSIPPDLRDLPTKSGLPVTTADWDLTAGELIQFIKDLQSGGELATSPMTRDGKMKGRKIYERYQQKRNPPRLVGRGGGLEGKLLTADLEQEEWEQRDYEISYSRCDPPPNWFRVRAFIELIELELERRSR